MSKCRNARKTSSVQSKISIGPFYHSSYLDNSQFKIMACFGTMIISRFSVAAKLKQKIPRSQFFKRVKKKAVLAISLKKTWSYSPIDIIILIVEISIKLLA